MSDTAAPSSPPKDDVAVQEAVENTVAAAAPETDAGDAPPTEEKTVSDEPIAPASVPADEAPNDEALPAANGTPATPKNKKSGKRKSAAPGTDSKAKKLNRKQSMIKLHLDAKPGQYWYAHMKGFPPWPAVICDEEMLPESLLGKRPVGAMRPDGTYREDFMEGGKNVRERRYPVMFLGSNEFYWQVNTELSPLDMDTLKEIVSTDGHHAKKNRQLAEAYEVAAENHDLEYFKKMLRDHEERTREEREEKLKAEELKLEAKPSKKKSGKVSSPEDVEMDDVSGDADETEAKPKSKKRKKDLLSDVDTPKKLKVKANIDPTPKPKKASKPKKTQKAESDEDGPPAAGVSELSAEEKLNRKQKTILYIRHKLQRGFLSRDQAPKDDDMPQMAEYLDQLEGFSDLEATIIRGTKINKVLKGVLKLSTVPRDDEFDFKQRCSDLLQAWAKTTDADEASAVAGTEETATNGVHADDSAPKALPTVEDIQAEPQDASGGAEEAPEDVPMEDAKESVEEKQEDISAEAVTA
ncbi:hypothetical protein EJ06DRAFT_290840 [Trichodelitschia bisporula]|uniref:PWWP domain-containing protein n=1 Tax=Trichodelitschia bisporula TaxID=703511 RepID=A0A6G1I6B4_9PEZI|nr:hypothetical protein EJ06DRAFT_290840 [Trichodelitschia bisporula]